MAAAEIDCQDVEERLGQLQGSWDTLREAAAGRLQRLREASEAQQYYLDAGEAEAWIGEQEFYVFSDENPQVGSGRVQDWGPKPAEKKGQRGDGLLRGGGGHLECHVHPGALFAVRFALTQEFFMFFVSGALGK